MDGEKATGATVTIRVVRSFVHRNIRHLVLHDVNLNESVADFLQKCLVAVKQQRSFPPPVKNYPYDTLKVQPHVVFCR
jgi:hypothetical protein